MTEYQVEFEEFYKATNYVYCVGICKQIPVIACGGTFENVLILNKETGELLQTLEKTNKLPILQLIFTQDNHLIQLGFDQYIVIYKYQDEKYIFDKKIETPDIFHRFALTIQNDQTLVSVGDQNTINFVDLQTNQISQIVVGEYNQITCLASNSQNKYAIAAGRVGLFIIDLERRKIFKQQNKCFTFYAKPSNNMAFYIYSSKMKCIQNNKIIRKLQHSSLIIRFTKDDKYCLMGGMDFFLGIYDIALGSYQIREAHEHFLFAIEFKDENENTFFTGSRDFKILKWTKINKQLQQNQ